MSWPGDENKIIPLICLRKKIRRRGIIFFNHTLHCMRQVRREGQEGRRVGCADCHSTRRAVQVRGSVWVRPRHETQARRRHHPAVAYSGRRSSSPPVSHRTPAPALLLVIPLPPVLHSPPRAPLDHVAPVTPSGPTRKQSLKYFFPFGNPKRFRDLLLC